MFMYNWEETKLEGVKEDFRITDAELDGIEVLLAAYEYEDYSGSAVVVFKRDSKLWAVHGSHCSCHGLEEQWEPEETTIEALEHTLVKGWEFKWIAEPMRTLLDRLKAEA